MTQPAKQRRPRVNTAQTSRVVKAAVPEITRELVEAVLRELQLPRTTTGAF